MIQTTLFFILGFLSAGLLALMVAPAIWRRAVVLTRRRIEASVPLTLDEIQADKDRIRADYAMSTRRLEISVKSLKDKAAAQLIEINRYREDLRRMAEERDEQTGAVGGLEARTGDLQAELRLREEQLIALTERLNESERKAEERALALEQMERVLDETAFEASSRQIEIVAQETKFDKLSDDMVALRNQRKEAEGKAIDLASVAKAAQEALDVERAKTAQLEKKVDGLIASLADRDDKLERREAELARLRDSKGSGGNGAKDRQGEPDAERPGQAMLREQINSLAAEVVNLTALLDAPDSPIHRALESSSEGSDTHSLADRVRSLQKASSSRNAGGRRA